MRFDRDMIGVYVRCEVVLRSRTSRLIHASLPDAEWVSGTIVGRVEKISGKESLIAFNNVLQVDKHVATWAKMMNGVGFRDFRILTFRYTKLEILSEKEVVAYAI